MGTVLKKEIDQEYSAILQCFRYLEKTNVMEWIQDLVRKSRTKISSHYHLTSGRLNEMKRCWIGKNMTIQIWTQFLMTSLRVNPWGRSSVRSLGLTVSVYKDTDRI